MKSIGRVGDEREGERIWGHRELQTSTWTTWLGIPSQKITGGRGGCGEGGSQAGPLAAQCLCFSSIKWVDEKPCLTFSLGFYEDNRDFSLYKMGFTACEDVKI